MSPKGSELLGMQAFIAELKRRKVFRVAVAYSAAAWALLQVADVALPLMGLPDESMRIMLVGIAAGFPVAMLLSWLFDVTVSSDSVSIESGFSADSLTESGSDSRGNYNLQFLLTCALVMLIGFLYYERLFVDGSQSAPVAAASMGSQSIAVLPFVNMSSDSANVYFSDGISEELLNVLAKVEGLRVAARTSSFHFRDSDVSIREIGRMLGVSTVLEGSVRRTENAVRVTAQLIDASNGYHLWSESYDGELEDIFALQDKIAEAVVHAIKPMILDADVPAGPATDSFDAYNAYLMGRARLREPLNDSVLQDAVAQFTRATTLDPSFADAYAGICDARLSEYTHTLSSDAYSLAESACLRALARAGSDAPGWDLHIALAVLYREAGEYEKSLESLMLAEEVVPDKQRTLEELGMTHAAAGRAKLAEDYLQRAVELDTSNWDSYLVLANFYIESAQYQKALDAYSAVLAIVPDLPSALIGKGSAHYMQGESDVAEQTWLKAVALAESSDVGSLGIGYTNLGLLHYYEGDYEKALQMQLRAAEFIKDDHRVWGRIAETYRALGNAEQEENYYSEAIRLAERDARRNPQDWETLGLLGLYHGYSGHRDAALGYLQRMLDTEGSPATSHYFAALIHWSLDDAEEAYDELQLARRADFSRELLENDPDLKTLRERDRTRWQEALATEPY